MPTPTEEVITVQGFRGVNLAIHPAFLSDQDLQSSENLLPSTEIGLLSRRNGYKQANYSAGLNALRDTISFLLRTYDQVFPPNRLMFLISSQDAGPGQPDVLYVNVNDALTSTAVTAGAFVASGATYGGAVLGNILYLSNGNAATDNYLMTVNLTTPTTAGRLTAIAALTDTGQAATAAASGVAAPASVLPSGTYSYKWAVFDTTNPLGGVYVKIGPPRTVQVGDNQVITFSSPTVALGANQTYHVLVAPANLPVEFAYDQTPNGLTASPGPGNTIVLSTVDVTGNPIPTQSTIARVGRFIVAHRGTLFIAGDLANRSFVYQSGPIVPGLEQTIFNLGNFFPALAIAKVSPGDGDEITGLGIASLTTTQQSPSAPLAIFKNFSTWLLQGNLYDSSGVLTQLSSRIGCISHRTIVNTPVGLIFCAQDSVYLLPSDLTEPVDIGWPIAPIIKTIPDNAAQNCWAVFHNGFYILALVDPGTVIARTFWALDLRRGQLSDPPSWWGPQHPFGPGVTAAQPPRGMDCATLGVRESAGGVDRWWVGIFGITYEFDVGAFDQDNVTIMAHFLSKPFDDGAPFYRKIFTRARLNVRSNGNTSATARLVYDGGMVSNGQQIVLPGINTVTWDRTWNVTWGSGGAFIEGDTRFIGNLDRQPHRSAALDLVYTDAPTFDLEDIEVAYVPVDRPVA